MGDKRMWTAEETEAFVGFMEEFVVDGSRPDCGQFKNTTFEQLALKMLEKFPNCMLTAKHCRNKHKRMKEKYQYAADMLACSGFGWNEERQCVEVDSRDVLDAWLKAHPKKFYSPGKPYPMFQRLGRIFGKDRATGNAAVSGVDAEEQMEAEPYDDGPISDDQFMSYTPTPTTGGPTSDGPAGNGAASSADQGTSTRRLAGRKRKQSDILERIADEVHESTVAQREHVQILANAISGKNEEVKMGEKLAELGFGDDESIQAVIKICSDPRLEKSFWGLTDAQKTTLAQDVLAGKY